MLSPTSHTAPPQADSIPYTQSCALHAMGLGLCFTSSLLLEALDTYHNSPQSIPWDLLNTGSSPGATVSPWLPMVHGMTLRMGGRHAGLGKHALLGRPVVEIWAQI